MDINKLIQEEHSQLISESFKKIIGGVILAYALTAPIKQDIGTNDYDKIEYSSKINDNNLKNIMKSIAEKYPTRVEYMSFVGTGNNDLQNIEDKSLLNKPYTLYMESSGGNLLYHILVGDEKIINYFKEKYLKEVNEQ